LKKEDTVRQASSCDISGTKTASRKKANKSALYRHKGDMTWSGVADQPYKAGTGAWSNIIRRVLIGDRGESTKFHVRYFEISPGGASSLEKHRHEHVVICVKGEGFVRTGKVKRKMGFMDTLYICPDTIHQLTNPFEIPFGFFCIVNARRDKPKVLD
jgi:quercetin dioxygenase-like cupin family protein